MSKDLHALTGAYVMDALDDDERAAFEAYMATSPATQAEVASLLEVGAMLGAAAAETPPEGLRRAVMSEIDNVRQERPVVTAIEEAPSVRPVAAPASRSWVTRLSMVAAAAAVAVSVGLGVLVSDLSSRLDALETTNTEVATLVAATDAARFDAGLPDGGVVTAVISDDHHAAVTVADGLPVLDEQLMYVLWAIIDGTPIAVGELHNGVPLTTQHAGLDGLGLTVEPRDAPLDMPTGTVQVQLGV